jgi:hypothetical protein
MCAVRCFFTTEWSISGHKDICNFVPSSWFCPKPDTGRFFCGSPKQWRIVPNNKFVCIWIIWIEEVLRKACWNRLPLRLEIVPDLGACYPKRTIKVHDPIYKQDGMPHCSKIIASWLVAVSTAPLNPSSWGGNDTRYKRFTVCMPAFLNPITQSPDTGSKVCCCFSYNSHLCWVRHKNVDRSERENLQAPTSRFK